MKIEEKLRSLNKQDLAEMMSKLSSKIDSGRHTGADVQILKLAVDIYMEKFEK